MKTLKVLSILIACSICSSAHSLESWIGERFIYSTSDDSSYALKVNFRTRGKASLSAENEVHSKGTYSTENGNITIELDDNYTSTSFPFKPHPETKQLVQVPTLSTIKQIVLSGNSNAVSVVEKGTECSTFTSETGADLEICSDFENDDSKNSRRLVLRPTLKGVDVDFRNGGKFVIPMPGFNSAYVQVDSFENASPADDSVFINTQIKKIKQSRDGKVLVELNDGSKIVYSQTRLIEGHSRVLGVLTDKNLKESLITGLIVKDQNVDPNLVNPPGVYKAVMIDGKANLDLLEYTFTPEGFGGFETTFENGETFLNPWFWDYENGAITALRYRRIDESSPIETEEDVKECLDALEELCYVYNKRSYKVLAKVGDKYTMFRKFQIKIDGKDSEFGSTNQSVWVMYKK